MPTFAGIQTIPEAPSGRILDQLHADIGRRILDNKRQAERLAADAKAVDPLI
jgi:hypothetical protein